MRSALEVPLQYEHVREIDLQLAIWLREDLVRIIHEVLICGKAVADENREAVFVSTSSSTALLPEIRDCVREADCDHSVQ